jgi:hypothetical protein
MTVGALEILIMGSLFVHAVAHAIAFFALVADGQAGESDARRPSRARLVPRIDPRVAARGGAVIWFVSTTGFLVAAVGFWGLLATGAAWRSIAVASSCLSILGIAVRGGTWPGSPSVRRSVLNTVVATTMNVALLATLVWLRWPPQAMFGR